MEAAGLMRTLSSAAGQGASRMVARHSIDQLFAAMAAK
jgi:hypothetical protein